jgi:predicted flap endonuclease-1-like 5' DNA nuclease
MEKPAFPTADTEKMLSLPVGALSPLWLMFAGAATVGAAWYWSRAFFKPTNLEALITLPEAAAEVVAPVVEAAIETVEAADALAADLVEAELEAVADVADMVAAAAPEPVAEVLAAMAPEPTAVETMTPDDLTVLTGIGPKLAAAFAERGVTTFAQIAAWTDADIARFDKELKLMGRIGREAWIAQASRLAAV